MGESTINGPFSIAMFNYIPEGKSHYNPIAIPLNLTFNVWIRFLPFLRPPGLHEALDGGAMAASCPCCDVFGIFWKNGSDLKYTYIYGTIIYL